MTITQLEYIVAVDKFRNFAEAAKSCFVTQPTLSMQIKKIENELNVLIFDRSKKPVLPTDIGQLIIEQAKLTLQEASRIKEVIQNQREVVKGQLRIGIIPTLSPYLLPLFVTEFIEKYKDIDLIIEELLSEQILEKLSNDRLDVGIMVTPYTAKSIIEIPLFYESFVVYASTSHPLFQKMEIDHEELDFSDMWILKEGHCFRNQSMNICGDQISFKNKSQLQFESGSLETLKKLVEKQFGFTLLPELATYDLSEKNKNLVKHFSEPKPIREISLVIHRSYMKRKLINLLKQEILLNIPEEMKDQRRGKVVDVN